MSDTLQQLVEKLQSIRATWKLFGLFLGIPDDDLEAIDVDKKNVEDKLYVLCYKWLQMKPRGTWNDIVKALKKIQRLELAERLEKKYIKHHLPSSESMSSIYFPNDHIEHELMDMVNKLAIKSTFLLTDIQSGLKQKLINNQLNLDQLGRFISDFLSIPYEPLQVTEGRDEIETLFSQFRDYLSFLHTDLLRHIDKQYLNCMLQDEIKRYDDDIDEFMKSTTVIAFKIMIQSKVLDKGIPVILGLRQHWKRIECLRHLSDYLFEDSSSLLQFGELSP